MKLVFPISLIILLFVSCSNSNCDCSYEAFKKLKHRMNIEQVEKILKSKPNKAVQFRDGWMCYSYSCNDNTINVMFDNSSLDVYSFNTDLRKGLHVIKMK